MEKVNYPLFLESLKRLIATHYRSGSSLARFLKVHPCTVFEWNKGKRMPKPFLREILKIHHPGEMVYDDEL